MARRLPHVLILILACISRMDARRMFNACSDVSLDPGALNVVTPTLKYTVTNFDPSWFDTDHPEKAPTLFTLTIAPGRNLDSLAAAGVRLHMIVQADTSLGRNPSAEKVLALDRLSIPLSRSSLGIPLRSNDVFAFTWEPGGQSFTNSPLFDLVLDKRQAPEMNLIFRFALTCEDNVTAAAATATIRIDSLGGEIGRLRYVKTIQSLYPGTQITNPKPVPIYTINPIFKVTSELFSATEFEYPPGEPKIEIFIYELQAGESPNDAMQGLEFAKIPLFDQTPTAYPANLPRLEPGKTYVWRARAILRGPTTDYLYSNPLYFHVDEMLDGASTAEPASAVSDLTTLEEQIKYGDDYTKRVMAALKIILGDNFEIFDLSRGGKVPAKGQIRLNGHPYSLEELERLAREFSQSKQSVTRLRFQ